MSTVNNPKTIAFSCTSCGRSIRVKEKLAGKTGKCPNCSKTVRVPDLSWGAQHDFEMPAPRPRKTSSKGKKKAAPTDSSWLLAGGGAACVLVPGLLFLFFFSGSGEKNNPPLVAVEEEVQDAPVQDLLVPPPIKKEEELPEEPPAELVAQTEAEPQEQLVAEEAEAEPEQLSRLPDAEPEAGGAEPGHLEIDAEVTLNPGVLELGVGEIHQYLLTPDEGHFTKRGWEGRDAKAQVKRWTQAVNNIYELYQERGADNKWILIKYLVFYNNGTEIFEKGYKEGTVDFEEDEKTRIVYPFLIRLMDVEEENFSIRIVGEVTYREETYVGLTDVVDLNKATLHPGRRLGIKTASFFLEGFEKKKRPPVFFFKKNK